MTNWRWWLCALLFVATTVNYLDRQLVISFFCVSLILQI